MTDFAWNLRLWVPVDEAPDEPESGIGSDNDTGSPLTGNDPRPPLEGIDEFIARNFVHSPPKASQQSDTNLRLLRDHEASQAKVKPLEVNVGITSEGHSGRPSETMACAEEVTLEATTSVFSNNSRLLGARDGDCSRRRTCNSRRRRRDSRIKSGEKTKLKAQEVYDDVPFRVSPNSVQGNSTLGAPLLQAVHISRDFHISSRERAMVNSLGDLRLDLQSTAFTTARSRHPVSDAESSDMLGVSRFGIDHRVDGLKNRGKTRRSVSEVESSAPPSHVYEHAALAKDYSDERYGLMRESVATADVPVIPLQKPIPVEPVSNKRVPVKSVRNKSIPAKSASVKPVPVEPDMVEPIRMEPIRMEPVHLESVRVEPVRMESARVEPAQVELAQAEPVPIRRSVSIICEYDPNEFLRVPVRRRNGRLTPVTSTLRPRLIDRTQSLPEETASLVAPDRIQVANPTATQVVDSARNHAADHERSQVVNPHKDEIYHRRRTRPPPRCSSAQEEPVWSRVPTSGSTALDNFSTSGVSVLEKIRTRLKGSAKSGASRAISKTSGSQCFHEEQFEVVDATRKSSTPKSFMLGPFNAEPKDSKRKASIVASSISSQLWSQADYYSRGTRWNEMEQHRCVSPTFHTFLGDVKTPKWTDEGKDWSTSGHKTTLIVSVSTGVVSTAETDESEHGVCKQGDQLNARTTDRDSNPMSLSREKENSLCHSWTHDALKANGVEVDKGLKNVYEFKHANGLNCANKLNDFKGLNSVNKFSKANGLNFANSPNDVIGSTRCVNVSGRVTSHAKESLHRSSPRRLPLCPVQNRAEQNSPTSKMRGSDGWISTSSHRTTTLVDGLNMDFRKDSWTLSDEWSVNYGSASEASSAISKLLHRLHSESSPCSSSPVLRVDFDDRRLALVSAHDGFTADCRAMTCSAPRSKKALVDSIRTSMRSFAELIYRSSRLVESISLRRDTDKVKDAVDGVANAYQRTMTAASDVYEQALRSSDSYSQALRSSDGYSSSVMHIGELTSEYSTLNPTPEYAEYACAVQIRKRVRKAIQQPASELVEALCSLKTLIQNLDYDKLGRRF